MDLPAAASTSICRSRSGWCGRCFAPMRCRASSIRPGRMRSFAGQTDAVVQDSVDYLCEVFRNRPAQGKEMGTAGLASDHRLFPRCAARGVPQIRGDRGRPAASKTDRENHRRVLSADRRGRPQLQHPPLAGSRGRGGLSGARSWSGSITGFASMSSSSRTMSASTATARVKLAKIRGLQKIFGWTYNRMRAALGDIPHEIPDQYELRRLAAPYFHHQLSGGEGDMLVGKALWSHLHKKAHMICELSPYACMPNTMSVGAMAGVIAKHPDLLYAPLEIKGDAEVHALSRCQMILTEAKKRARSEFEDALSKTGLTLDAARARLDRKPDDEEGDLSRSASRRGRHGGQPGALNWRKGGRREDRRNGCGLDHRQGGRGRETTRCCGRTISATIRGRRKRFSNSCRAWRANAAWSAAATSCCSPARAAG